MKKIFAALYYVLVVLILITTMTHCTKSKTCYCIKAFSYKVVDATLFDSVGLLEQNMQPYFTYTEDYEGEICTELDNEIVDSQYVHINGTLWYIKTMCNDQPTSYEIWSNGFLFPIEPID